MNNVVVIGAGIGGLSAAAALARAGLNVTVLEAHVYPGGCAGTFYYQGFRFDAGATLAGGFRKNGPMDRLARMLGLVWRAETTPLAMRVHLPNGQAIDRWSDDRRWEARREAFGREAEPFWLWQEHMADLLWGLMSGYNPIWPPQSPHDLAALARQGLEWLVESRPGADLFSMLRDAFRPIEPRLNGLSAKLRAFIDGQLLISAQATSTRTNALYGAAALDLPRQGVVHFEGGMGTLAEQLVEAVKHYGGDVQYRKRAAKIILEDGVPRAVETDKGQSIPADLVIANLPSDNLAELLPRSLGRKLSDGSQKNSDLWGAFVVYLGLDGSVIPDSLPLHHQILHKYPLSEGNSIFMSASDPRDLNRAPLGHRAVTLSTHTRLGPWWKLLKEDPDLYEQRKTEYLEKLIAGVETVLPGVRDAISIALPGTPATFHRYTSRHRGWVGGYPQTSLFRARGPRVGPNIWMVGDSIFPGQSTTAVALGGLRVAGQILGEVELGAEPVYRTGIRPFGSLRENPLRLIQVRDSGFTENGTSALRNSAPESPKRWEGRSS